MISRVTSYLQQGKRVCAGGGGSRCDGAPGVGGEGGGGDGTAGWAGEWLGSTGRADQVPLCRPVSALSCRAGPRRRRGGSAALLARVRNNAKRRVPCAMQEGVGNSCGIRTEADGAGCQKQTGDGGMTWSVRCRTVCKVLCMLIWLGRYIQLRTIGSRHGDHGGRFNLLETKFIKHHISWPAAESNSHARSILARRVVLTNTSDSRAPDRCQPESMAKKFTSWPSWEQPSWPETAGKVTQISVIVKVQASSITFLAAAFLGAAFFGDGLGAGSGSGAGASTFLAGAFSAAAFLGAVFLGAVFLGEAAFLVAVFLAAGFLDAI